MRTQTLSSDRAARRRERHRRSWLRRLLHQNRKYLWLYALGLALAIVLTYLLLHGADYAPTNPEDSRLFGKDPFPLT